MELTFTELFPPQVASAPLQAVGAQFRRNLIYALSQAIHDSKGGLIPFAQTQLSGNLLKWRKLLASIGISNFWLNTVPQQVKPLLVEGAVAAI